MQPVHFEEILETIVKVDPRYHRDGYIFLREALDYTQKMVGKAKKGEIHHVSGQELLEGIREYAISQFGPMTLTVLDEWGIRACEDFGEMVFNMVANNLLAKTDKDSRDDFKRGYSFEESFRKPFLPTQIKSGSRPASAKRGT